MIKGEIVATDRSGGKAFQEDFFYVPLRLVGFTPLHELEALSHDSHCCAVPALVEIKKLIYSLDFTKSAVAAYCPNNWYCSTNWLQSQ